MGEGNAYGAGREEVHLGGGTSGGGDDESGNGELHVDCWSWVN